jgi:predicted hydrocarbon binding protein
MHDCSPDGEISIGGVNEQFFSEGFIPAWHDVLVRELGDRAPAALWEVGFRGGRWEVDEAIRHGVWVPALLRGFVGKPELLAKARTSAAYHLLLQETLRILYRMIMTEGGWGVVERVDFRCDPARYVVRNTPESRTRGKTGACGCHINAGIYAGHLAAIFGVATKSVETECVSRGDARCVFEVSLGE